MPQSAATIDGLPKAFAVVKAMEAHSLRWGKGYRALAEAVPAEIDRQLR